MEIYGNTNIDIPLFTDQLWRRKLTERIMPYIASSFHGKRKMLGESKANRKVPFKNSIFSQKSRSNFSGAGNAKNWKINPADT